MYVHVSWTFWSLTILRIPFSTLFLHLYLLLLLLFQWQLTDGCCLTDLHTPNKFKQLVKGHVYLTHYWLVIISWSDSSFIHVSTYAQIIELNKKGKRKLSAKYIMYYVTTCTKNVCECMYEPWTGLQSPWSADKEAYSSSFLYTCTVADISNTSATTHSPLIMKLPVVRYSPVGAVLDTWRENQEEKGLYRMSWVTGWPGYGRPTRRWWPLWLPRQSYSTLPLMLPRWVSLETQVHILDKVKKYLHIYSTIMIYCSPDGFLMIKEGEETLVAPWRSAWTYRSPWGRWDRTGLPWYCNTASACWRRQVENQLAHLSYLHTHTHTHTTHTVMYVYTHICA